MKKNKYNINYEKDYSIKRATSSSNDCTGLTPTPPENEAEAKSYCDVYDTDVRKSKL